MRIAVFGRGALAASVVRAVRASGQELVLVGDHRTPWWQADPVRAAARGIPRGRLTDARAADLWITADCPRILPPEALAVPARGVWNVHWSLLPRHRGPCPATATLLAGDPETGVTVHVATPEVDAGPVVAQWRFPVGARDTAVGLYVRAAHIVRREIPPLLDRAAAGSLDLVRQGPGATTHSRPTLDDTRLDWTLPAVELDRRIRAFTHPLAWTTWRGRRVWVSAARPEPMAGHPGAVRGRTVATGTGGLRLERTWLDGWPWVWWPRSGEHLT